MKDDVVAPKRLINIKEIKDLRGVSSSAQGLRMGPSPLSAIWPTMRM